MPAMKSRSIAHANALPQRIQLALTSTAPPFQQKNHCHSLIVPLVIHADTA